MRQKRLFSNVLKIISAFFVGCSFAQTFITQILRKLFFEHYLTNNFLIIPLVNTTILKPC